ncbi:LamG domain-containing protein [Candidatus Poribacteria bacterium]|jgi:arabinan endo-1,5-alpha-L-arabinosidase|nr:LamG domain-containing protein [Candidatus Poribacteria bacterium]MBT5533749.1 LamG domain-containing protein [Candidatus Poribacteria bacterium]MBT5712216.1 LamG domain-containing protein [Candidatus Poribacteria bacterium]MBT7803836.1 LamG domain-containing protein [Candidatus Poribacteria bacterium]
MRRRLQMLVCRAAVPSIAALLCAGAAFVAPLAAWGRDVEGLIAYFGFEEGDGGTVSDTSGSGHEGELLGDMTWDDGRYGGGLNFGGDDGYVRVPDHADFEFVEGVTLAAWIRPTLTPGPGEWQLIAAKGQDAAEFFEILLNPAGYLWMGWQFPGGRIVPDQSPPSIVPDEWQHVAVSYQIDEWWAVYLDGEILVEYPAENQELVPNTDDLLLGVEEPLGLDRFYNGGMDEFVLYDRGLTQDEIQEVQAGMAALLPVDADGMSPERWGSIKAGYER